MKYFVEIGSADFDTLLPMCDYGWKGICVEPVEGLYQNLSEEAKSKKLPVETLNCAISERDGEVEMVQVTRLDWEGEQAWANGVSHISQKHNNGKYSGCLLENINDVLPRERKQVPCQSLNSLINYLRNESVVFRGFKDAIGFMRLDTEGHEVHILDAYNWEIKPSVIKVEHAHCDKEDLRKILQDQKYFIQEEQYDFYGLLQ
jgi:FkbM family methyltransferase